jgi:hypothetical protein
MQIIIIIDWRQCKLTPKYLNLLAKKFGYTGNNAWESRNQSSDYSYECRNKER